MPLAAPIGTGLGIQPTQYRLIAQEQPYQSSLMLAWVLHLMKRLPLSSAVMSDEHCSSPSRKLADGSRCKAAAYAGRQAYWRTVVAKTVADLTPIEGKAWFSQN